MIGRLLKLFLLASLAVLIFQCLLGRRHKRALHETVQTSALICLSASALALAWYYFLAA
ncbi:protein MIGRI [Neisseria leonii]|uniref:protein MIGRI n=1 Tax=Neisseria leonii TaxID=2995413 RepID=UPI00237A1380|nr:hypothetical protein [Neisseria sp. 3986]MDD9325464.1 hypothetical protein [Neisseria sp. 3986]